MKLRRWKGTEAATIFQYAELTQEQVDIACETYRDNTSGEIVEVATNLPFHAPNELNGDTYVNLGYQYPSFPQIKIYRIAGTLAGWIGNSPMGSSATHENPVVRDLWQKLFSITTDQRKAFFEIVETSEERWSDPNYKILTKNRSYLTHKGFTYWYAPELSR